MDPSAPSSPPPAAPPGSPPGPPPAPARPQTPRENCPEVADCISDAAEIGHICPYGPICGTCVIYRPIETARGLLLGTCRVRQERGEFPCTAPICDAYLPRQGALDAKGRSTAGSNVALNIARAAGTAVSAARSTSRRNPTSGAVAQAPIVKQRIPDGPCGELEMNREELKALIREAMDEERGGTSVALAPKWEGGTIVLKPHDPTLQGKELPLDALLHKVVMVRDRLRVLEQKINANPKMSDAEKVDMQVYVTACYGSLTTFNVLFRDKEDGFTGSGGK
jgi:hypothetical protein